MYRLQYLNLVVETSDEEKKNLLVSQGYKVLDSQEVEEFNDSQEVEEETKSYKKKTTEELREIAREKGIEQVQNLTKKELLSLLEGE